MTEAELVSLAKTGNAQAMNQLLSKYYPLAFYRAEYYIQDKETAHDAAQNAMFRAWRKFELYNSSTGPFRAWLMTIVQHECFAILEKLKWRSNIARTLSLEKCLFLETEAEPAWLLDYRYAPEEFIDDITVLAEIKNMPSLDKRIFELRSMGYGHDEIAGMLNINTNYSKKHLRKTRSYIKERMYCNV